MKLLGTYRNGNYRTIIFDDGTKIRTTKEDEFHPDFAENIDVKLTNKCTGGCRYCHEGSCPDGEHADILNEKFISTLHPYQEIALGGGDATGHPDLIPFLRRLKKQKAIANLTVNQVHFEQKQDLLRQLVDEKLIYGLGVSLRRVTPEFVKLISQYENAVIHTINGIVTKEQIEALSNKNLKILILGYKQLRNGVTFYEENAEEIQKNQKWLKDNLGEIVNKFRVVSFDNLAIEQLAVRNLMSDEEWNEFYMGDDSEFTFYIDMVNRKFAKNSIAPMNERYDLLDSVDEMFERIKK